MNNDTISRQAAIDALYHVDEYNRRSVMAIRNLPSAESFSYGYENDWIPCSEKMPEDGTEVFVYLFNRPSPYIAWIEGCRWHTEDFEVESENEPIAWMPLPEPASMEV